MRYPIRRKFEAGSENDGLLGAMGNEMRRLVDTSVVHWEALDETSAAIRQAVASAHSALNAAHVHSPAGEQGMNTGIQDASNVGWKLVLALKGAPGCLLAYHHAAPMEVPECAPVIRRVLKRR